MKVVHCLPIVLLFAAFNNLFIMNAMHPTAPIAQKVLEDEVIEYSQISPDKKKIISVEKELSDGEAFYNGRILDKASATQETKLLFGLDAQELWENLKKLYAIQQQKIGQ